MFMLHRSGRRGWARFRVLVAAVHIVTVALIAPMLVLCDDGQRHTAVESAISLCCPQGSPDSIAAIRLQATAGTAENPCAGSCTDTPLLTNIDATSPKSGTQASDPDTSTPPLSLAPRLAPVFAGNDAGFHTALSAQHLSRPTVLRI